MYYIVYSFFFLLSLLPWRVLYIISDLIYLILYYIIGYRKEVVMKNLTIAFPEKTEKEKVQIAKQFYHNFIDNFIEVIKLISASKSSIQKRFKADYSILNELYEQGLNTQVHLGHFFNWEYANLSFATYMKAPFVIVYMPISNKAIDKVFYKMRTRMGSKLVAATNFRNEFMPFAKDRFVLVLVGDQNPGNPENAYWVDFFGKKTPIVKGPERGAKLNRSAVVMISIHKIKRGYYESKAELLTTNARELPDGAITEKMIRFIERSIRQSPSNYLWSHRRWKFEYDEAKHKHLLVGNKKGSVH